MGLHLCGVGGGQSGAAGPDRCAGPWSVWGAGRAGPTTFSFRSHQVPQSGWRGNHPTSPREPPGQGLPQPPALGGRAVASPSPQVPGLDPKALGLGATQEPEWPQWRSTQVARGDSPVHALGPSQGSRESPRARSGSSPPPTPGSWGPCCARPRWGHRARPPREAQQVDARVFTWWLALSLPSRGWGHRPLLRAQTRMQSRLSRVLGVPRARWESLWALEVSQRSCHLWSVIGASCQVRGPVRPPPPPPLRALPWAPPGVSQGARVAGASPNRGDPVPWPPGLRLCDLPLVGLAEGLCGHLDPT